MSANQDIILSSQFYSIHREHYLTLESQSKFKEEEEDSEEDCEDTDEGITSNAKKTTPAPLRESDHMMENRFQISIRDALTAASGDSGSNTERLDRKLRAFQDNTTIATDSLKHQQLPTTDPLVSQFAVDNTIFHTTTTIQQPEKVARRSIDQFLQDQKTFEQRRVSKQLSLLEKQAFFTQLEQKEKPQINKRSMKLGTQVMGDNKENIHPGDVHSRLYKNEKSSISKTRKLQSNRIGFIQTAAYSAPGQQSLGQSKSSLSLICRERPLTKQTIVVTSQVPAMDLKRKSLLAKTQTVIHKRQTEVKEAIVSKPKDSSTDRTQFSTQASQRYLQNKVLKELQECLSGDLQVKVCFSIEDLLFILSKSGYLPNFSSVSQHDLRMLSSLWTCIAQHEMNVSLTIIQELLFHIQGLPSKLHMPTEIQSYLHQLYSNKISKKHSVERIVRDETLFKPQISRSSEKLALIKRQKMIQSTQSQEWLMFPIESHRMVARDREQVELSQCTFQPKILKSHSKDRSNCKGEDRFTQLYEQSKNSTLRRDRSSIDLEFEKSQEECTFKPTLIAKSATKRKSGNFQMSTTPSVMNSVQTFGPQSAQEIKPQAPLTFSRSNSLNKASFVKFEQTGAPPKPQQQQPRQLNFQQQRLPASEDELPSQLMRSNSHVDFTYHQKQHQLQIASCEGSIVRPLLYIDVNICPGRSERISVFEWDNAHELALRFSIIHSLPMEMRLKLEKLLTHQITEMKQRGVK